MTFFNKKEDVIKIQLTPYGKSLLSQGRLKAEYYAFFDDDILYDSNAAGFSESQAEIQSRILNNTPYVLPQSCLESPEKTLSLYEMTQESHYPHTALNLNYLTTPMGTSDQTSIYAPAWKSTFLKGSITGSVETVITGSQRSGIATVISAGTSYNIGSEQDLKQIPQINSVINYKMRINNVNDEAPVRGRQSTPEIPDSNVYPDGTYVKVITDQVLCQLLENEGFIFSDGLEVEAFIYGTDSNESLRPLKFLPTTTRILNGMLVDIEEQAPISIDSSYVEYYINFNTDNQISNEDLCEGIQLLKSQDILLEIDVECPDNDSTFFDIYGTRVTEIEDCE